MLIWYTLLSCHVVAFLTSLHVLAVPLDQPEEVVDWGPDVNANIVLDPGSKDDNRAENDLPPSKAAIPGTDLNLRVICTCICNE